MALSSVRLLLSGLGLASLGASAVTRCRRGEAPSVTVRNGTYSGVHSSEYDQDFFLGVPYAQVHILFFPTEDISHLRNA